MCAFELNRQHTEDSIDGVRRHPGMLSFMDPDRGNVGVGVAEIYDAPAQVTRGDVSCTAVRASIPSTTSVTPLGSWPIWTVPWVTMARQVRVTPLDSCLRLCRCANVPLTLSMPVEFAEVELLPHTVGS